MDDFALLQSYAKDGSQEAFRQLVDRHLGLVYSAAKRQVGSPDLAKDVSQAVFLELARQAAQLRSGPTLGPWLYVITRRKAIDLMRREGHRHDREKAAADAAALESSSANWIRIEPLLDEAMESLGDQDRQAVVLRFFENRSLRQVGAVLGVSDDAAQKRLSRALERLREGLGRRGVAATAAGLATALSADASGSAPAGLAASISAAVGAASLVTSSAPLIAMTLLQKSLITAVLLGAAGALFQQHRIIAAQSRTIDGLQAQVENLRRQARNRGSGDDRVATHRNATSPSTAASPDDPVGAALSTVDQHISQLQDRFERDPSQRIPEMSLLKPKDWITVAMRHTKLETDDDWLGAMADVRDEAEFEFAEAMRPAMKAYLKANQNQLPADFSQVGPYFDPPIDPAIFARYQMLQTGDATASSPGGPFSGYVGVKLSALVDPQRDDGVSMSVDNTSGTSVVSYAGMLATIAYRAANNGRSPQDPSELVPYFNDPALAQKYVQDQASRQGQPH